MKKRLEDGGAMGDISLKHIANHNPHIRSQSMRTGHESDTPNGGPPGSLNIKTLDTSRSSSNALQGLNHLPASKSSSSDLLKPTRMQPPGRFSDLLDSTVVSDHFDQYGSGNLLEAEVSPVDTPVQELQPIEMVKAVNQTPLENSPLPRVETPSERSIKDIDTLSGDSQIRTSRSREGFRDSRERDALKRDPYSMDSLSSKDKLPRSLSRESYPQERYPRDNLLPMDYNDMNDPRDIRNPRDRRDPHDPRHLGDPRDMLDPRDSRDRKEMRDSRDPRDMRDSRDPRDIRDSRDPRDMKDPRDPRNMRDPRDLRESRYPRDHREAPAYRDDRFITSDRSRDPYPRDLRDPRSREYYREDSRDDYYRRDDRRYPRDEYTRDYARNFPREGSMDSLESYPRDTDSRDRYPIRNAETLPRSPLQADTLPGESRIQASHTLPAHTHPKPHSLPPLYPGPGDTSSSTFNKAPDTPTTITSSLSGENDSLSELRSREKDKNGGPLQRRKTLPSIVKRPADKLKNEKGTTQKDSKDVNVKKVEPETIVIENGIRKRVQADVNSPVKTAKKAAEDGELPKRQVKSSILTLSNNNIITCIDFYRTPEIFSSRPFEK